MYFSAAANEKPGQTSEHGDRGEGVTGDGGGGRGGGARKGKGRGGRNRNYTESELEMDDNYYVLRRGRNGWMGRSCMRRIGGMVVREGPAGV